MSEYVDSIDIDDADIANILNDELEHVNSIFTPSNSGSDPISLIGSLDDSYDIKGHNGNVIALNREQQIDKIRQILGCRRVTNSILYPENGYMGWHTNSNAKGDRIYIIYNYGMSVFAYVDPDTKETVFEIEPVGEWFARRFTIPKDKLLWHAVGSSSGRISYGFYV